MRRQLPLLLFILIYVAALKRPGGLALHAQSASPPAHSILHPTRQSRSDLEITGMVRGLPANAHAYLTYAELTALPQLHATVSDDPDLPGLTMHVSGVALETLASAVGALPGSDLMDAMCSDRYRSHYPADYVAEHHPILVLTIDGMRVEAWAAHAHQDDPGPYLVLYDHFVPAFHVLSHTDRPQLPTNLVRLNFSTTAATFGAIAPRGSFPANSPEQQGFAIAKQNCLRCHAQGPYGGAKAGRTWETLGRLARARPAYFSSYIRDPKSQDAKARMPGNPEYDAATLDALTEYFRTFAPAQAKP